MDDQLNREDLAVLIRGRQISRQIGLASDADIKTICEHAGISRKTGYQWAGKYGSGGKEQQLEQEIAELKADNEKLIKELDEVRFENEGRKLAWEIHNADELLKEKKAIRSEAKAKSGEFLQGARPTPAQVCLGAVSCCEHLGRLG